MMKDKNHLEPLLAFNKNKLLAGHQWLTPVILATQEERSGGSQFKARPGK
jgi:hypothetical protein